MINYLRKNVHGTQIDINKKLLSVEHKLDYPSYYYGNELNSWHKEWTGDTTKGLFINPVGYEAGINGLGVSILYHQVNELSPDSEKYDYFKSIYKINDIPNQLAERAYMPDNRLYTYLKDASLPVIFGVESKRPWNDFDWLGFSIYFELQFFNIVAMMYDSGIPVYSDERISTNDNSVTLEEERLYPIVFIGGISAYCSEGVSGFYDFALIGDGEAQLPKVCELLSLYKNGTIKSKLDLLRKCAHEIPGCYVPRFYEWNHKMGVRMPLSYNVISEYGDVAPKVVTKALFDITKLPPFYKQLLPQCSENLLGYSNLEVNRGCHNFCRFCKASACHKPVREHSVDAVIDAIKDAPKYRGAQNITPYSLNYTGYTQKMLLAYRAATESQKGFTTSTQRADTFSVPLAATLHDLGDKGCTFAIENGSQKMRNVVNKEITDEQILYAVKNSVDIGYSSLKFYMISCLPWETDEDRYAIVNLMREIVNYINEKGKKIRIRISFTPFTACPHTALQYADCSQLEDNLTDVYEELRKLEIFDQRSVSENNHFLMQLMNRTDRRFNDIIAEAVINYGIRYNGRHIKKGYDLMGLFDKLCLKYTGVPMIEFLKEIPVDAVLPWEVLSNGISKEWLIKEYQKAKNIGLSDKTLASVANLEKAGVPYELYEGKGLLTEEGNPNMWVNTNIKVISKERMPSDFIPLDSGLTPSCMKTCNKCGVCQNPNIIKQGGKMATYHLELKDIPEEQLIEKLKEAPQDTGYNKLLLKFKVACNGARYIPQQKFKLLLKSAFACVGILVKEKMEILSEAIPFDNHSYGTDVAMMRIGVGTSGVITSQQLEIINTKLNGQLVISSVKAYRSDGLVGLRQLQDYILYKVALRLKDIENQLPKLDIENGVVRLKQRKRGEKQGRSEYVEIDAPVYLLKAVPLALDNDGNIIDNAVKIYFAIPFDISPYDFLKSVLDVKNKREVIKYPVERLDLIRVPKALSLKNPKRCGCGNFKETDMMGTVIDKNKQKCIKCLINEHEI